MPHKKTPSKKSQLIFTVTAFILFSTTAVATNPVTLPPPDSGSLLQQNQQVKPVIPSNNATSLAFEADATPTYNGSLLLDNYGNTYTGKDRITGAVNINNPLHLGDVLSATLTTTGRNMDDGLVSYEVGSLELRRQLGRLYGEWQAIAFMDSEHIKINDNPWAPGINGATLNGAGLGLNWANEHGWHGRIYGAAPMGSAPELLQINKSIHTWAEVGLGL